MENPSPKNKPAKKKKKKGKIKINIDNKLCTQKPITQTKDEFKEALASEKSPQNETKIVVEEDKKD